MDRVLNLPLMRLAMSYFQPAAQFTTKIIHKIIIPETQAQQEIQHFGSLKSVTAALVAVVLYDPSSPVQV